MKRYECLTQAPFDMEETPDGAWVFFDDVQEAITAAVAAERERIDVLVEADVAYERKQWEYVVRMLLAAKWCSPEWDTAVRGAVELLDRPR